MRVLPALLVVTCASAATVPRFTDPDRRAKLIAALPAVEQVFERFQQQRHIPGLVYGVVIDGETVLVKGLGVRDRASNDPVTPDTGFRIASMTKSFTALAILKLRDEGQLSLEDPVSKWIPEFEKLRYPTADTPPIRIRQLLTHGAGFPEDNPWGDRQLAASDETLTQWLKEGLPFSTPPDTAYEYSNYGFALLGRIVAKASKMSYREYLERRILSPLGMNSSSLEARQPPAGVRAIGYGRSDAAYSEIPALAHGAFGSMGGLWTTARDLGRYVAFHLSAYPPRDEADAGPVRRSSIREQEHLARFANFRVDRAAPDVPLRAVAGGYGYGVSVTRDCRFNHIVAHGGGLPGFGSYMLWLPDYGVGLFAMANLTYAGPIAAIDEALDIFGKTGALQARQLPASPELESARKSIVRLWHQWDDREARTFAADNLFLDRSAAERRQAIDKIEGEFGQCQPSGDIHPENLLRGKFRLSCDRGFVEVAFTLAPTMPPKLQSLTFQTVQELSAGMRNAAGALAAQFDETPRESLDSLVANPLDVAVLRHRIDLLRPLYGSCTLGETTYGDGKTAAGVHLACQRGRLDLGLGADGQGKLISVNFVRPADSPCVQ